MLSSINLIIEFQVNQGVKKEEGGSVLIIKLDVLIIKHYLFRDIGYQAFTCLEKATASIPHLQYQACDYQIFVAIYHDRSSISLFTLNSMHSDHCLKTHNFDTWLVGRFLYVCRIVHCTKYTIIRHLW